MIKISDVTEKLALFIDPLSDQKHLRTTSRHSSGSVLHDFSVGEYVEQPTYLSLQIGHNCHIHLEPQYLQYLNHSCDPNVFVDVTRHEIICLRDIEENEEVTFFYPSTEWAMEQVFNCRCRSLNCLGEIKGAMHLDKNLLPRYKFTPHIMEKLYGQVSEQQSVNEPDTN
ncbi:MAG: SET domain-containing protein [Chlorobiaceae bacterium]|nr:SET domain-containing protein [Chlorobiaceae bacterium]